MRLMNNGRTNDQLAELEDRIAGLSERYREASESLRAAAEQLRVMRETTEFAAERKGALQGDGLEDVRKWLQKVLDGVAQ